MRWTITKGGRQRMEFRQPRAMQKVLISQTTTTTEGKIKKVIALAQKGEGRMKAGWLVAVAGGAVRLKGSGLPPQWVKRHAHGAKGKYSDGTANSSMPSFTITNNAAGIGQKGIDGLVRLAVSIRAKAMVKNASLFASGKKEIGSYA
jgi:hypothetical protein